MIYLKRDNKRKNRKLALVTGFVAVVFLFSIILNFFQPNFLSPVTHAVLRPVLEARGGFWGSIRYVLDLTQSKSELVKENQSLKDKLVLFDALEQERDYYKDANANLLNLADKMESLPRAIFARVLSKPGFSPYDTAIINAGVGAGIEKGYKVLADQDTVLGIVSEVYGETSVVTLYSSPGIETSVLVGKSAIQASAVGKGGGNFEIKLPRNTDVVVGDSVSLALPSPAFLGKIEYINTSSTDSFEWAIFKSAVDIGELSFVAVLKP